MSTKTSSSLCWDLFPLPLKIMLFGKSRVEFSKSQDQMYFVQATFSKSGHFVVFCVWVILVFQSSWAASLFFFHWVAALSFVSFSGTSSTQSHIPCFGLLFLNTVMNRFLHSARGEPSRMGKVSGDRLCFEDTHLQARKTHLSLEIFIHLKHIGVLISIFVCVCIGAGG